MSKKDTKKAVGNAFEDLKAEEMAKTQGAGDTEAEAWTPLAVIETPCFSYGVIKSIVETTKN